MEMDCWPKVASSKAPTKGPWISSRHTNLPLCFLMYGGLCPPFVSKSSPLAKSTMPTARVTNMQFSLLEESSRFTFSMMSLVWRVWSKDLLNRALVTDMNSAAGTPLPETSPTQK